MKKNTILFFVIMLMCSLECMAQHYYDQMPQNIKGNSNWILGDAGVNLNTNPPQMFHVPYFGLDTSAHDAYYGSPGPIPIYGVWFWSDGYLKHTNVSDPETGALIFNVKNHNCYNKNYQLMPHGYGAIEDWANYVSGNVYSYLADGIHCVVPCINSPGRYYYFSAPEIDSYDAVPSYPIIRYSIVDMRLDGGLGDIDTLYKNRKLYLNHNGNEYVSQIYSIAGNNCDMWLIAFVNIESTAEAKALIYHITEDGIDTVPQLFHTQSPEDYLFSGHGKFVISPNRKSILFFTGFNPFLLKFDPENGVLQSQVNVLDMHISEGIEDVAFTSDGRHVVATTSLTTDNRHTKSIAIYDFKYNRLTYVRSLLNVLEKDKLPPFLISLNTHGDRLYFNVMKDTTYPAATYYPYHLADSSWLPAGSLSSIKNINAQSWEQFESTPEIYLPFVCGNVFPKPVVHPYYPTDTIPDVYMDTLICSSDPPNISPLTMTAKPGFTDYIWNDGTPGQTRIVDKAGRYWVYYRGQCNERVDSFIIATDLKVSVLPADTVVCEQRFPFKLQAGIAEQYLWFDNNIASETEILQPGIYWLQYLKNGCYQNDTVTITSEYCPCHVSVPSGFTPNGDGLNDYFKPSIAPGCVPSEYALKIYNRWGQMVYSSFNEFDLGWNGQYKNGIADVGTYFYELKFKSRFLSEPYYKKGEFVLIK